MDGDLTPWEFAKRVLPFKYVTSDEIYDRLSKGLAHLWVNKQSAAVTEVTDANTLRIWLAGGRLNQMLPVLPDVEAFAKALGCKGVELEGREGWLRVLSPKNYVYDGQRLIKWL